MVTHSLYNSHVTAVPGAPDQHWHRDVGGLHDGYFQGNDEVLLPSHGLVVFIPTADVTMKQGPTHVRLGSHLGKDRVDPDIFLIGEVGTAVLYDLRAQHRGTANRSKKNRSVIYMTYLKEWFADRVNFREKQTRNYDKMPSDRSRKLLGRLDARQYVDTLEKRIKALGGNVDGLSSQEYSGSDIRVHHMVA